MRSCARAPVRGPSALLLDSSDRRRRWSRDPPDRREPAAPDRARRAGVAAPRAAGSASLADVVARRPVDRRSSSTSSAAPRQRAVRRAARSSTSATASAGRGSRRRVGDRPRSTAGLPVTLAAVLVSRLDRLDAPAPRGRAVRRGPRRALRASTCWPRMARTTVGGAGPVADGRRGRIAAASGTAVDGRGCAFRHALLRDAAYEVQLDDRTCASCTHGPSRRSRRRARRRRAVRPRLAAPRAAGGTARGAPPRTCGGCRGVRRGRRLPRSAVPEPSTRSTWRARPVLGRRRPSAGSTSASADAALAVGDYERASGACAPRSPSIRRRPPARRPSAWTRLRRGARALGPRRRGGGRVRGGRSSACRRARPGHREPHLRRAWRWCTAGGASSTRRSSWPRWR